ncbi:MAG: hypothetical protein FJ023_00345 [Chloroflexi bacterium]|nr:hypothetical protein [Chloroflexota bacterium]
MTADDMNKVKILIIVDDEVIGLQVYPLQTSDSSKDLPLHVELHFVQANEKQRNSNDAIGLPPDTERQGNPGLHILSSRRAPEAWQALMN